MQNVIYSYTCVQIPTMWMQENVIDLKFTLLLHLTPHYSQNRGKEHTIKHGVGVGVGFAARNVACLDVPLYYVAVTWLGLQKT